jgi:hypothetical protein
MGVPKIVMLTVLPLLAFSSPLDTKSEKSETAASASRTTSDPESETSGRTELNLLGKTDTESGESRRNENVQFNPIDNNALKELNKRLGTTATVIPEFKADQRYFGAEFGNSPGRGVHVASPGASKIHGTLFYGHGNSSLQARSFFQVGDVKPAQEHDYGFNVGVPVWSGAYLSVDAGQRKLRGNVNGNVLVPKADERTPLTDDPQLRPLVEQFLSAYPAELPNRTDVNERALNTNSQQRIDDNHAGLRLDQTIGARDSLTLKYDYVQQRVTAFQLVAGQNPDTTTRVQRGRTTWNRQWTVRTLTNFTMAFDRIGSQLFPEKNAVGPLVLSSHALEMLGPSSSIPIDRMQNLYRPAGEIRHMRGDHNLYAGFDSRRRQYNGYESSSHRGTIWFRNDFGRDSIKNLRMGIASKMSGAYGHIYRGFRRWEHGFYVGDDWKAKTNLTLTLGLRYEPASTPNEVNNFSEIPFRGDRNNFAPRFGFAWRAPGRWGVVRASYGLMYGEIFPTTFGQLRYNPPLNAKFELEVPDLRLPVEELLRQAAENDVKNTLISVSPDLATPYGHQYNFSWEPRLSDDVSLQLGYVGSRSKKLLGMWAYNRARVVPGIEQSSSTVQERRPDQNWGEVRTVRNGSSGYYDAALATVVVRRWTGFSAEASYWFSKALDLGSTYTNTAAGRDAFGSVSPYQDNVHGAMKALSSFDQPHSFLVRGTYEIPWMDGGPSWMRAALQSWNLGAVVLLKSGTPFSVSAGADSPGYGNVDGSSGDRPHLLDPSILGRTIGHPDTSAQLLPREAFRFMEPTEKQGNLGRNTFRKGSISNVNAMLSRTFPLGSDRQVVFRAESVNLLNTPQFADPGRSLTSDDFASITNTLNDGRAFRFLLQFYF